MEPSFAFFPLPLSQEYKEIRDRIHIQHLCNHREILLSSDDTERLLSLFEESGISEERVRKIVVDEMLQVLRTFQHMSGMETGLVILRTHPPSTTRFKERRWHMDGYWFKGGYEKYGMTLLGPSTLFADNVSSQCRRMLMQNELTTLNEGITIKSPGTEEAARWVIGQPHISAIHSEPYDPEGAGRIFISFTPGSREQLKSMIQ